MGNGKGLGLFPLAVIVDELNEFAVFWNLPGCANEMGGGNGHGPFCKLFGGGGGGPKRNKL